LLLAGCTASPADFDVAARLSSTLRLRPEGSSPKSAFQRKLDAWKPKAAAAGFTESTRTGGTGSLLPVELTSGAQNTPEDTGGRAASATQSNGASRSGARPVQGPMLNAIVDRVMEHVDSVTADAKVNFKNRTGLADGSGARATAEPSNTERGTVARANLQPPAPPPPAPPADFGELDSTELAEVSRAEEFAEAAGVLQDVPAGWTGAVIYSQPGCRPCEREINAIRNSGGWTVGYGAAGFRSKAHFVVIVLTRGEEFSARGLLGTPTTVYFRAGREVGKRIVQFGATDAELTAILAAHPSANKASVKAALESACPCAAGLRRAQSSRGVCTCVNGCRCGAACRCVTSASSVEPNCPGRAAVSTPLYYDATRAFAGGPDCGAPLAAANYGGPSVFAPAFPSASSYIGASVAVPSQVGFGISAFGTPLFGASIGACGPGGCAP